MQTRCNNSSREIAKSIKDIFNSDNVKGSFIIQTASYENARETEDNTGKGRKEKGVQQVNYQDFRDSLEHSNVTASNAARLYKDGNAVPQKPSDFFCEDCTMA